MVTTTACSRPEASYKNIAKKRVKCLFLYLKLNTTLQIGTSIILKGLLKREIKRPGLTFGQLGPEDHSIMYIYEQNFYEDRNAPITAYQRATISDT